MNIKSPACVVLGGSMHTYMRSAPTKVNLQRHTCSTPLANRLAVPMKIVLGRSTTTSAMAAKPNSLARTKKRWANSTCCSVRNQTKNKMPCTRFRWCKHEFLLSRSMYAHLLGTYFLTFCLTYLLTFFLTYLSPFFLTYLLAFFLTYLLTFFLTYLLTCLLTYLLTVFLTYLLTFFLTYLLTFFLTSFWHIFWHSFWHIFWHSFWHIFWHSFWRSFCHSFWQIFWHITWGPGRHTELTGSRLRSGTPHWTRGIAVVVRHATLNSRARGWGPARHTVLENCNEFVKDKSGRLREHQRWVCEENKTSRLREHQRWPTMSTQQFEETLSQLNIASTVHRCNTEGGTRWGSRSHHGKKHSGVVDCSHKQSSTTAWWPRTTRKSTSLQWQSTCPTLKKFWHQRVHLLQ